MTGGDAKPDPAFFEAVARETHLGDRLDNDIRPAVATGFWTALILRGPRATIKQSDPGSDRLATMRIESLAELPDRIATFNDRAR